MSPTSLQRQVIFLIFMVGNSMKWQSLWVKFFQETCISVYLLEERGVHNFPFLSSCPFPYILQEYHASSLTCHWISSLDCLGPSLSCWDACSMNSDISLGSGGRQPTTTYPNLLLEGEKTTLWETSVKLSFKMNQQHYGRCHSHSSFSFPLFSMHGARMLHVAITVFSSF